MRRRGRGTPRNRSRRTLRRLERRGTLARPSMGGWEHSVRASSVPARLLASLSGLTGGQTERCAADSAVPCAASPPHEGDGGRGGRGLRRGEDAGLCSARLDSGVSEHAGRLVRSLLIQCHSPVSREGEGARQGGRRLSSLRCGRRVDARSLPPATMHARLIQSTRTVARLAHAGARLQAPAPAAAAFALPRALYVPPRHPTPPTSPGAVSARASRVHACGGTFGTRTAAHGAVAVELAHRR